MDDRIAKPEQTTTPARGGVQWRDLREFLALIDRHGLLKTIDQPVDPDRELAAISIMATAENEAAPAFLFRSFPNNPLGASVVTNMLGSSRQRYALAMGLDPEASLRELVSQTRQLMTARLRPTEIAPEAAPVNEVIETGADIDLTRLPVPTFWPGDGGPYIGTANAVFTRGPDSPRINVGCYRQMLQGPDRVGMYITAGKHGRIDRDGWWQRGEPCEVVAAFGVDPVLFMMAGSGFSKDESELDVAGGIMGRPVELTRGVFGSLPIPARAELVVEGILRPGATELEGPLGEFTGYFGNERGPQPVIEVKAVHRRKSPIITSAIMARYPSSELGTGFAIMRSSRVLDDLTKLGVPGIEGVYATPAALGGYAMLVVSIRQMYPGHSAQVLGLAAQCPAAAFFTKWIVVVDHDVDPTDFNQVLWALSTRVNATEDLDILRNTWSTPLDPPRFPASERPYGSKVLINACKNYRHYATFPKETRLDRATYEKVRARWKELGLTGRPPDVRVFHGD
ncbi:MAG TPA: UbiD family decarboxylase [Pseudolabrys sp.]|nr:UbiD family decarboxylase [Pseudolabrys sp.]